MKPLRPPEKSSIAVPHDQFYSISGLIYNEGPSCSSTVPQEYESPTIPAPNHEQVEYWKTTNIFLLKNKQPRRGKSWIQSCGQELGDDENVYGGACRDTGQSLQCLICFWISLKLDCFGLYLAGLILYLENINIRTSSSTFSIMGTIISSKIGRSNDRNTCRKLEATMSCNLAYRWSLQYWRFRGKHIRKWCGVKR